MYRSLYSVIKPIINSKTSGTLDIVHYSNNPGRIYISSGAIVAIKTNEFQGTQAAREIFSWVSFLAQFKNKKLNIPPGTPNSARQTKKIMTHLSRINKKVVNIKKYISGCETVLRFDKAAMGETKYFTEDDLRVATAMDGSKTVLEILIDSELTELEMLMIISRFVEMDFTKVVKPHKLISIEKSDHFFKILSKTLSGITGPIAKVMVDEAYNVMGLTKNNLCRSDLGPLLNFIRKNLNKKEQKALNIQDIVNQAFQK